METPARRTSWRSRMIDRVLPTCLLSLVLAGGVSGAENTPGYDVTEYLLSVPDFVVSGTLVPAGPDDPGRPVPLVAVTRTIVGSAPSDTFRLSTLGSLRWPKGVVVAPGAHVLAWGGYDFAGANTCIGNLFVVRHDGGLIEGESPIVAGARRNEFTFAGRSVTRPKTCDALLAALLRRRQEHPAGWLESGSAVAEVRVTSRDSAANCVTLERVAWIAGAAPATPRVLRWSKVSGCAFIMPPIGTWLVISVAAPVPDTLVAGVCLDRLRGRTSTRVALFGADVGDLGEIISSDGSSVHIRPVQTAALRIKRTRR